MAVRYLVEDVFQLTGQGPTVLGVLVTGVVRAGMTLELEGAGTPVRVRAFDLHTRETERGRLMGLHLHPEDAPAVLPGSVLVSRPQA